MVRDWVRVRVRVRLRVRVGARAREIVRAAGRVGVWLSVGVGSGLG